MGEAPFFHVGILVPDLTEATSRFSDTLGLTFAEPARSEIPELDEGGVVHKAVTVHVTYSVQGPPHLELIEATGDGVYGAHNGYGVHHLGRWVADSPAFIETMAARGLHAEATFRDGEVNLGAYFRPGDLLGVRFESCPTLIREGWREWIDGGTVFRS